MPTDYQNILTDLVKRVRPLLVSISESVTNNYYTTTVNPVIVESCFIQVMNAYNYTTGPANVAVGSNLTARRPGVQLTAAESIECYGAAVVGVAGTLTITPVVGFVTTGASSGNFYFSVPGNYAIPKGASGLTGQSDSDSVGLTAIADPVTSGTLPHWDITGLNTSLTVAAGDLVVVNFTRWGAHASDTATKQIIGVGWRLAIS